MTTTHVPMITNAAFDAEVLGAAQPVLVKFGASWCPPCRRIAPEVEAVAAEMEGRALVREVDVDAEPDLSARFGVQSIPDTLIFKNGQVVDQIRGFAPRAAITELLEKHVE